MNQRDKWREIAEEIDRMRKNQIKMAINDKK